MVRNAVRVLGQSRSERKRNAHAGGHLAAWFGCREQRRLDQRVGWPVQRPHRLTRSNLHRRRRRPSDCPFRSDRFDQAARGQSGVAGGHRQCGGSVVSGMAERRAPGHDDGDELVGCDRRPGICLYLLRGGVRRGWQRVAAQQHRHAKHGHGHGKAQIARGCISAAD